MKIQSSPARHYASANSGNVSSTNHFWSFKAKQPFCILLNNWKQPNGLSAVIHISWNTDSPDWFENKLFTRFYKLKSEEDAQAHIFGWNVPCLNQSVI